VRVYCATFYGETNTFSPLLTGKEDFVAMALAQPGTPSFAAAFSPVYELGGEVVGRFNRAALPGGTVLRVAYESLRDELLAELASQLPVDLVVLNLHGAMVAQGVPDCEGDVLEKIRALVARDTPIVASLDPHAHLSAAMLRNADALVAYREYPHIDEAATFAEVVRLGVSIAARRVRPCMTAIPCGQIAEYHTMREPMRGIVAAMRAWERTDDVLAVSLIHGFPWGDVADMGTQSLVVTDGNPARGREIAQQLNERIRSVRGRTSSPVLPFTEALEQARASRGPVIVADVSDNPGGGAAGDSTFLLHSLLERPVSAAFGPLWDPPAVMQARKAGAGARLTLRVGGKSGAASGAPADIEAVVIAIAEELRTDGVGGYEVSYGRCASLRVGPIDIVLTSEREQAMSPAMFTRLGIALEDKQIIVVKSAQHFRARYAPLAREILHASSPGALDLDFAALPYRAADRALWPLTR
jgi:microcystin degradation protein MlrC